MIKKFEFLIKLFIKKIFNIFLIFFALIFILGLFEEITFGLQKSSYFFQFS